jgi:hypothetical protein
MFIEVVMRNGKVALINLATTFSIKAATDDNGVKCVVFTAAENGNQIWAPGCLEQLKEELGLHVKAKVAAKADNVKPLKGKASKQA